MHDLELAVSQDLGKITANFDEIKTALAGQLKEYKDKEFTEDKKKDAKEDLASLRKLKKSVDDRRKEVKKVYMKPYDDFDAKVKELIGLIDEPIKLIDYQVKSFEANRVKARKEEIKKVYEELVPDELQDYIPLERIYGPKWDNKTTTMKSIKTEISSKVSSTNSDIAAIKAMRSEKEETALNLYMENNNLAIAIKYLSEYENEKMEILRKQESEEAERREQELEAERQRIREEERRRVRQEEEIRATAEKKVIEDLKTVDEEKAAQLSTNDSKTVIYTVVATEEELADIEQAMTSFGVYFERKDA
ncbi:DUF1351 domain-containing protein [Firmicutes bacterium AM41-5BH]|nr:DUF1351 domain-containing protein [Firmicutes bacterium AM41-5BH]